MNIRAKIDPKAMQSAADDASTLLKALANRHRLLILCQLIDGEKSVGELADFLGVRDSTASQHLALLRRDRIISGRRDGQTIWYRISSRPARDINAGSLRGLLRRAEAEAGGTSPMTAGRSGVEFN